MKKNLRLKHTQSAFTLIEVMVVVVILAILAAIVVPRIMNRPDQAKIVKAKEDIMAIENAMDLYKLDNGFYPSTDQGIQALVSKPNSEPTPLNWEVGGYLKHLPTDPWGRAYHFANPGSHGDIDIYTDGAAGKPNGSGINATIGNWNIGDKKSSS